MLLPDEWAEFQAAGRFTGSPFDQDSGFVHCSSRVRRRWRTNFPRPDRDRTGPPATAD
ncbi:DUF952 domain-containing protein [Micromonospora radicis]|uniref:DUF952 domain-containing protein n=1 Tax=Micromonospora radicis TaxID=1894971 RepID=A0A418MXZ4_9ACTN|nr:DUF952 domain-containing protein [Micromonospora radicis]